MRWCGTRRVAWVEGGEQIPAWHGLAWWDPYRDVFVTSPLGLHWRLGAGRRFWLWTQRPLALSNAARLQNEVVALQRLNDKLRRRYDQDTARLVEMVQAESQDAARWREFKGDLP